MLVCAAVAAAAVSVSGQAPRAPEPPAPVRPHRPTYGPTGSIEVLPVQGSVYLLAGGGSNVVVQVGDDAVLVVDTNTAEMGDKMLAAIRSISKAPIRYIVNTSADRDHAGGNAVLAASAGAPVNAFLRPGRAGLRPRAHLHAARAIRPTAAIPRRWRCGRPMRSPAAKKTLFVTGEPIEIIHQPAAHSDGDVMVFFRKSDVVAAGDVFVLDGYPVIDPKRGGSLQGVIDALNRLVDIAIPEFNTLGGTRIVPGHGRITNEIDAVEYRDMLTIIRDRVALLVGEGRTLEQVNAARVSLDYDGVYGTTSGPWTTEAFIAAAYRELSAAAARERSSRAAPRTGTRTRRRIRGGRRHRGRRPRPAEARPIPFDGTWVLDLARSRYTPSSNAPYRRETTIAIDGDAVRQSTSTWRRMQGNDSPLRPRHLHRAVRRQGLPGGRLVDARRAAPRRRHDHRAHGNRRRELEGDGAVDALRRPAGADDGDVGCGCRGRARTAARRSTRAGAVAA